MEQYVDLVGHWRLAAPVQAVWSALADPDSWHLWWPCVQQVQLVRAGGADGLGSVHRYVWRTGLPYEVEIEVEAVESVRHERLRGRSRGAMDGEGIWLLSADGAHTDVTCVWRVNLVARWMRWLAPLLAPLVRWNHHAVMRAGGAGLARYLAAGRPRS